jgi:hypothetical protein
VVALAVECQTQRDQGVVMLAVDCPTQRDQGVDMLAVGWPTQQYRSVIIPVDNSQLQQTGPGVGASSKTLSRQLVVPVPSSTRTQVCRTKDSCSWSRMIIVLISPPPEPKQARNVHNFPGRAM